MQRILIIKYFQLTLGSVCRVKQFSLGGKRLADGDEVETEVRKLLRQQSKHFYATSLDVLVKQWDKCINVCREIDVFSRLEYNMFYDLYPVVTYLQTLSLTILKSLIQSVSF
jgi:hypothetical protein